MATPFPFTTGELLTAAKLNATSDVPRVCAYNTTDKALGAAAYTLLTFDSELYDTNNMHSTTTNTGRLTVQTGWDGYYYIFANAVFTASCSLVIYKNNVLETYGDAGTQASVSAILDLNATDYITIQSYSGTAQTAYGSNSVGGRGPVFGMIWMAPG